MRCDHLRGRPVLPIEQSSGGMSVAPGSSREQKRQDQVDRRNRREDEERLRGGKDGSVQSEALGAEGSAQLGNTSETQGGFAGGVSDLSDTPGTEELDADEKKKKG
jgi:hypothetical protein